MYGSGLRLMEVVRLRVKDIDFDHYGVQIWQGKGGKNRQVTLAKELCDELKLQILVVIPFCIKKCSLRMAWTTVEQIKFMPI
ncbi:hypothetical protein FCS21_12730 [Colwellia ponticola]|uniref:Tyr recombinase domain-containing protein n=1 Tax=Colwellia ponticola TaxID=2304625 RepID=A0A8H2PL49_9GAMM|nr:hypothetical protein FCS21_12730 [Colwellia ponticola]